MGDKRVHVVIRGWVQGVGFRASCARQAMGLGLTGWVRNQWDGSVEALFEGPAEAVDRMVAWCHRGPAAAEVTAVEVSDLGPGPQERSFRIR
ncbi:MAG: acylphosphatase [Chloroflexi bacterium]|nr:acylphosphatase [Chloroflexota bacterium]